MTGFQLICDRGGLYVGQEICTLSETPDLEFMISQIHYIHYLIYQSTDYVDRLMTDVSSSINLSTLSRSFNCVEM